MSIYSEYIDRITNGNLDARHGGSLTTTFEKVAKSVRDLENKITVFESSINPLYEKYNGGYINGDYRYLETIFTRPFANPFFINAVDCIIHTEAYNYGHSRYDTQDINVGEQLQNSYGYINTVPPFHDLYKDQYTWFIEMTNYSPIQLSPQINIYHPDGTLNVSYINDIPAQSNDRRICGIMIHSYQSIPKVLFHFYYQENSGGGICIDIRPSDEITYNVYGGNIIS